MRVHQSLACFVVLCLVLMGAGWWEGLGVGPEDFDVRRMSYESAVEQATQRLSRFDADDLMSRCRSVIEAGAAWHAATSRDSIKAGHDGRDVMAPETQAWLICVAALRTVGETGDERWVSVLEELQSQWSEAAYRYGWDREQISGKLIQETGRAYKRIVLDRLEPTEVIERWRIRQIERTAGGQARWSAAGTGLSLAFRELIDQRKAVDEMFALFTDPEPFVRRAMTWNSFRDIHLEAEDLVVAMLADSDPELRAVITTGLTSRPIEDDRRVPAFLRFLMREDIDKEARAAAIRGLLMRGYSVATGPDGRPMAIPIREDRQPITLPRE